MRTLPLLSVALLLGSCTPAEESEAPPGGGGAGPSDCAAEEELVGGACVPRCSEAELRDASGACVTACVPSCEGVACLGDDGCGGTCEAGCVRVMNVTDPSQEPLLRRDDPCLAWDEQAGAFLLHGGNRDSFGEPRLGPGACRLSGRPDEPVSDEDPTPRAAYCELSPACWDEGCELDGVTPIPDLCEQCNLDDTWQLKEEAPGSWRWTKLPLQPIGPLFDWAVQCVSAGSAGVLASGFEGEDNWTRWRWSSGAWAPQDPASAVPPVPTELTYPHVAWQPDCGRAGSCELLVGGCGGLLDEVPNEASWLGEDGAKVTSALPRELWRERTGAAVVGVPGGVFFYGGTRRDGRCFRDFQLANSEEFSDLLFWDGATLERREPAGGELVGPREGATIAQLGDRLVLFGGTRRRPDTTGGYPPELCELGPAGWACRYRAGEVYEDLRGQESQLPLPRPRSAHAMAAGKGIDGRPVVVLFGGSEEAQRGDTWVIELP